ncbi:hypothetical protein [Bradyrhizobium sp. SZCCHNR1075]|uniref:hypothetical protein n=1 Tax=Bradyrhizobium sp. SZCCHNR1075 TaxID=3057362 RepID=UPI0028E44446|nr:hypothetical protein [Bradyrhizobium sp. SZCCHNR1075]
MKLKEEMAGWVARVGEITLPFEGMPLSAFGAALRCSPDRVVRAARYLHRRKAVSVREQAGHIRIFPVVMRNRRGRPTKIAVLPRIDPRLAALLTEAHPTFLTLKLLWREMPAGDWRTEPERRAEIADAMAVESERIVTLCRRFLAAHEGTAFPWVRDALWLDQGDIMPVAAERQPVLALDGPAALPPPIQSNQAKRLSRNMSEIDRVLTYVAQAGREGITVSAIGYNFGGTVKRAALDDIVATLESVGKVIAVECRTASRGRMGTRLFDPVHGEPNVLPDGRLIAPIP